MANLRFYVHNVLTDVPLGELYPTDYSFNDPVRDNGQFTCQVAIPRDRGSVASLRARTQGDNVAIYVLDDMNYIWGGIINFRSQTPGVNSLTVTAQSWRAWFYDKIVSNSTIIYSQTDMANIANDLITKYACLGASGPGGKSGCPWFVATSPVFGRLADLTVPAGRTVGQAMDDMANRDDGFEWSIAFRPNQYTGYPEKYLEMWKQGQTRSGYRLLSLDSSQSTNRVKFGTWVESAINRKSSVWAIGAGVATDQPQAVDTDPAVTANNALLRETWDVRSGVVVPATLFQYARRTRILLSNPQQIIPVDIPFAAHPLSSYRTGDRARVVIKDSWSNIDQTGVRIINRTVHKSANGAPSVTLELDFNDISDVL